MFGRFGDTRVLGLPGNPVSSLVCAHLFLRPLVARLAGLPTDPDIRDAVLGSDMRANDGRRDYVRADARIGDGKLVATALGVQDSSMLKTLAAANALIVREPEAPAATAGEPCRVLMLR
jgi:molybdopterin molybdotransferase